MALDKNVILINEPVGTGAFVLLMSRPGGGMMSAAQAAFYVDTIEVKRDNRGQPYQVVAYQGGEEAVTFPWGIPFVKLKRDLVSFIDSVEAATKQREEEKAVEGVWKTEKDAETTTKVPGQYV